VQILDGVADRLVDVGIVVFFFEDDSGTSIGRGRPRPRSPAAPSKCFEKTFASIVAEVTNQLEIRTPRKELPDIPQEKIDVRLRS